MRRSPLFLRRPAAAVAAALLAVSFGCSAPEAPAPQPPQVTFATPERRPITRFIEYSGRTRAVEFAEIRARVPGSLDAMLYEPSVMVDEGQVLFEIEPDTYQATHDSAVAEVASAKSQLVNAEAELRRIEEAIRERAVSQADLDQSRAARDKAQADVLTAEARLKQASIDLDYTQVATPIPGQVSRNFVDVGNLVGSGEATLLTTVTRIQPIYVYFDASESLVLKMLDARRRGVETDAEADWLGEVNIATAADVDFPHMGRVDFVDNTVDPATGTIEVRAVLPNAESSLFPGLFVRVRLTTGRDDQALLINERAVGTDLSGKFVLVVGEGDVAEQRYVKLGPVQLDGTVVIDEGLEGDERYIIDGLLRARPGFPVSPSPHGTRTASPGSAPSAGDTEPAADAAPTEG